jgi:glyoxylase-like metal-dependent hydrolase (beta-lactamase superfamily II)
MDDGGKMSSTEIQTIDLKFQGLEGSIAVYLIPHREGAILVESGPGSTKTTLKAGLAEHGFRPEQVSDVLLTHIHLDHAGAAGWLSRKGARIHVHPNGAPHLLNPEKLLASAGRIYGDMMDSLWGEFLSVPEDRLSVLEDSKELEINGYSFKPIDTPGHASHHFAYIFEDICFSGDIGGVRLAGLPHIRIPMPPPEFHLEKWRESLERLRQEDFSRIAPTHFGIYEDADWHLRALDKALDEVDEWIDRVMPSNLSLEELRREFISWNEQISRQHGLDRGQVNLHEAANPSFMSADGIRRYWLKVRLPERSSS